MSILLFAGLWRAMPSNRTWGDPHYVSALDEDGNETAGVRLPDVTVPLATFTGWNVRSSCALGAPCPSPALLPNGRPAAACAVRLKSAIAPKKTTSSA